MAHRRGVLPLRRLRLQRLEEVNHVFPRLEARAGVALDQREQRLRRILEPYRAAAAAVLQPLRQVRAVVVVLVQRSPDQLLVCGRQAVFFFA